MTFSLPSIHLQIACATYLCMHSEGLLFALLPVLQDQVTGNESPPVTVGDRVSVDWGARVGWRCSHQVAEEHVVSQTQ